MCCVFCCALVLHCQFSFTELFVMSVKRSSPLFFAVLLSLSVVDIWEQSSSYNFENIYMEKCQSSHSCVGASCLTDILFHFIFPPLFHHPSLLFVSSTTRSDEKMAEGESHRNYIMLFYLNIIPLLHTHKRKRGKSIIFERERR